MSGSWSDVGYGYDQIGYNDPFEDEINLKYNKSTNNFGYNKNVENNRCNELLNDLKNSEEKFEKLKKKNTSLKKKKNRKIHKNKIAKTRVYKGIDLFKTFNVYIIFFIVIFILQMQIYENNKLIHQFLRINNSLILKSQ